MKFKDAKLPGYRTTVLCQRGCHRRGRNPFDAASPFSLLTQSKGDCMTKPSNRNTPVERWPESLQILRHLAAQSAPVAVKDVAREVAAPEISTRTRLARLEVQGAVRAQRATTVLSPAKQVTCTHYAITQYGKDCIAMRVKTPSSALTGCANSVFSWASAIGSGIRPEG